MHSTLERDVPEPIAIIGMSCRLSGIATSPEGLWRMLSKGLTGWSSSKGNRFQMDAFWHPQVDLSGSVSMIFSSIDVAAHSL
jgi:acyl transferase domain-containing protein